MRPEFCTGRKKIILLSLQRSNQIFLLPSPPWFETFQAAFLWVCMALGQSDRRGGEKNFRLFSPSDARTSTTVYWFSPY